MTEAKNKLRDAIFELLEKRAPGKTICPSEAARRAYPETWRDQMEQTRAIACDLARNGEIEICQRTKVVRPGEFSGPIRLRKPL